MQQHISLGKSPVLFVLNYIFRDQFVNNFGSFLIQISKVTKFIIYKNYNCVCYVGGGGIKFINLHFIACNNIAAG